MSLAVPKDVGCDERLLVTIGQYSAAGRKDANQDFYGAVIPDGNALTLKGIVAAIADGISTSAVSAQAAEIAVKALLTDYYSTSDAWTVKTAASCVIEAVNSWLYAYNRKTYLEEIDRGMVCTVSALILKGRKGHVLHLGDSRVSRLNGQSLEPLTRDHRLVMGHGASYLERALGARPRETIDYRQVDLQTGDIFVLTTDGVHEAVEPRFVAALLRETQDLDVAAKTIAQTAFQNGSDDNLTVQLVRIDQVPSGNPDDLLSAEKSLPIPDFPKIGSAIDGFRILRQVHSSHRSHIYLAAGPDGVRVALKIPSVDMRDDPDYLRRFVLEEWIARRLANDHVVKAAKAPERRTALYTMTEYVKGQTLRQWMRDHPQPALEDMRTIIEQIVRGLRAFHRRDMLHQDLRPENIMIDGDGTVKIIDFGSTHVAGVEEAAHGLSGDILGTAQYTAPEYFSGEPVSWRSDLFSLGIIAYELLTGKLPFGAQVAKVRTRTDQRRLRYRSLRENGSTAPDWMNDALRRAVHPDPLRRYEALSEFVAALRAPGKDHRAKGHVPLVERDPVLFWKALSALLAVAVFILIARLAT